jgi:DNA (cytosine-5)-methyltransferase 1
MAVQGWRMSKDALWDAGERAGVSFIDLFAGCGGLALGFALEGLHPVGAVEWEQDAADTYTLNIDERIAVADIAEIRDWPRAEVVVGGPPCQGFSQLGTRDPDDVRNKLWREYVRVLDQSDAQVFVMENVPQLLRSAQFALFRDEVERRGFGVASNVLCTADYGVPQMRYRAIVIGSRLGEPLFPERTHGPQSVSRLPYVTVRDAFTTPTTLPELPDGSNWHRERPNIRTLSITRYRAVPHNGGNRFEMQANLDAAGLGHLVPECWRRKTMGTTDVFGRLWWDRPALTIRTEFFKPEKGRYLHPIADRPITVREAARLQSFPDTFAFPDGQSMVSVARQIGNAVPPLLAAAIARAVLEHLWEHGRLAGAPRKLRSIRQLELIG